VFNVFASLISFFYEITHNYAFAIILLTVAVRLRAKQSRGDPGELSCPQVP
jgi:hypothetical protein